AGSRADRRGARRADAHRASHRVPGPQAAAAGGARDLDPGASRRVPAGAGGGPDQRRLDTGCPRGADGAHRLLGRTRQLRDRGELPRESRVAAAEPGHPPRALGGEPCAARGTRRGAGPATRARARDEGGRLARAVEVVTEWRAPTEPGDSETMSESA